MKEKPDLFDLIKSLSKSEKRYFKLMASLQEGEKKYLLLFDAIEQQRLPNDKELKERFANEQFVNQLHVAKNYLYKLILKSLNHFHAEESIDSLLKEMVRSVEILNGKSLYSQANILLKKAKKMAYDYENYAIVLDVLKLERLHFSQSNESVARIFNEEQIALKIMKQNSEYWKLNKQCYLLYSKRRRLLRNKDGIKEFKQIMKNPLLRSEKEILSYRSKLSYYSLHSWYYESIEDYGKALIYRLKILNTMEAKPLQIDERPDEYIVVLNNLLVAYGRLNKEKEFYSILKKLKEFSKHRKVIRSKRLQSLIFMSSLQEISFYLLMKEYKKGLSVVSGIERDFNDYFDLIPETVKQGFYFDLVQIYFAAGKYKTALQWVNKILDHKKDVREDLQCFAHIVNIIIHYELGNEDMLEYIIRSTYRFLLKRKQFYKFEKLILDFIRKLPDLKEQEGIQKVYRKLRSEMILLSKDPYEKIPFEYFDFISWVTSKIEVEKIGMF